MTLVYINYLIPMIIITILLIYMFSKTELKYFKWIKDHWFYNRSKSSRFSSSMFYIGVLLMLVSALDLRGPEEKIEAPVFKQETMILIDSSASMLVEDVRPNRFKKAIILAKHYVKKAVGHHISVTVFSDDQKKIIPYTNDTDLLEARLTGLESLDLSKGGTGLKLALQATVTQMKAKGESVKGNILVLTDAENNSDFGKINIQEDINIAVVGIGTLKGGVIPIRDSRGNFRGNKKFNSKEVVSKLNEKLLKELSSKIKNYKYWVASSYSLPTNEILDFFKSNEELLKKKDSIRVRPVLSNYILIPAVVFMILSFLFKNFNTFVVPGILLMSFSAYSQAKVSKEAPKKEKTRVIKELESRLRSGQITELEKKKLANELLKEKFSKESSELYKEIIKSDINEDNKKDYFNLGASELMNKKSAQGLKLNKKLYDYLEEKGNDDALLKQTKENMLKAIIQEKQRKNKEKEDKKKKNQKDKKDKKDNKKEKEGNQKDKQKDKKNKKNNKGGKKKKGDSGEGSSESDSKDKDSEETKESKDEKKEKQDNKNKKDEKEKKDSNDKNESQKDKDENKPKDQKNGDSKLSSKDKKKLPALLKQLMNDDNQLQRKVIDAETTKRGQAKKKDW